MTGFRVGSDFVRRPSFLEQRDPRGGFAQYLPQLTQFDEDLQAALLTPPSGDAGDRLVGWVSVAAWIAVIALVITGAA